MINKVTADMFCDNQLALINLVRKASKAFPKGHERDSAYMDIARAYGIPDDSFAHLI